MVTCWLTCRVPPPAGSRVRAGRSLRMTCFSVSSSSPSAGSRGCTEDIACCCRERSGGSCRSDLTSLLGYHTPRFRPEALSQRDTRPGTMPFESGHRCGQMDCAIYGCAGPISVYVNSIPNGIRNKRSQLTPGMLICGNLEDHLRIQFKDSEMSYTPIGQPPELGRVIKVRQHQ